MEIRRISEGKGTFLPLLLLGDEQENMVMRYLDRGNLYALYDAGRLRTVAVAMAAPWWNTSSKAAAGGEDGCWWAPETVR